MKRHLPLLFVLLTFTLTWALWIPATLIKLNGGSSVLGPDSVGQFGRWAPGLAATLLTSIIIGREGVGALFRPLKIWRVPIGWFLFALIFQPVLFLVAQGIDAFTGNSYEVVSPLMNVPYPVAFVIPTVIISAIPGAFMEELGWRGFALPRLQSKNNALTASIILGLVWGIWHIPSMVFFGETIPNILWAVTNFVPATILFTWLYNNTKGSLLLVTLYHASIQYSNNFLGVLPTETSNYILWVIAIAIVLTTGNDALSRTNPRIIGE